MTNVALVTGPCILETDEVSGYIVTVEQVPLETLPRFLQHVFLTYLLLFELSGTLTTFIRI